LSPLQQGYRLEPGSIRRQQASSLLRVMLAHVEREEAPMTAPRRLVPESWERCEALPTGAREAVLAWLALDYRDRADVVGNNSLISPEAADSIRLIDDLSESEFAAFLSFVRWHA
jgi:hypothetical protein